jgi:hypothetical protein
MCEYRADLTRLRGYWHAYFLLLYGPCLVYKACTDLVLGLFVTPVFICNTSSTFFIWARVPSLLPSVLAPCALVGCNGHAVSGIRRPASG